MTDTEPLDLDAIAERAGRAGEEVDRLCESRTNWKWSIPADPERDSDLILGASVEDVSALIAEVRRLREQAAPVDTDKDVSPLNEARMWARHGYEIGQRSCTWSDYGVAPTWLTEGYTNEDFASTDGVDR